MGGGKARGRKLSLAMGACLTGPAGTKVPSGTAARAGLMRLCAALGSVDTGVTIL